mmetsp:Transcript_48032/g.94870  ORF Transcript_48032/g.94870 Transcript_48032/m.94870 type:complete len:203 (+) Transcript_48032:360-968(+)
MDPFKEGNRATLQKVHQRDTGRLGFRFAPVTRPVLSAGDRAEGRPPRRTHPCYLLFLQNLTSTSSLFVVLRYTAGEREGREVDGLSHELLPVRPTPIPLRSVPGSPSTQRPSATSLLFVFLYAHRVVGCGSARPFRRLRSLQSQVLPMKEHVSDRGESKQVNVMHPRPSLQHRRAQKGLPVRVSNKKATPIGPIRAHVQTPA